MATAVLIPAYNPDAGLIGFVRKLSGSGRFSDIIVIDDGSRDDCKPIFARLRTIARVTTLEHAINLGKGAALKTGLNHFCCACRGAVGVVTADADGQHLLADVIRVADQLETEPQCLVLGSRTFRGAVPLRSLLGNLLTKFVFWLLVGTRLSDTQSGLRGIPRSFARLLLRLPARGYEFELDMLIQCKYNKLRIVSCPIETVYLEHNASSHFRPLVDSLKIYFVLLRFMLASVLTAAVDYLVFCATYLATSNIFVSHAGARLVALNVNFALARQLVFRSRESVAATFARFVCLVVVMGAISYAMIQALVYSLGCNVVVAKAVSELVLYLANFTLQREVIFPARSAETPPAIDEQPAPRGVRAAA